MTGLFDDISRRSLKLSFLIYKSNSLRIITEVYKNRAYWKGIIRKKKKTIWTQIRLILPYIYSITPIKIIPGHGKVLRLQKLF